MLQDRSTKICGSVGDGLRKKARRLGEEVKLGNYALDDEKAPQKRVLGLGYVEPQRDDDGLSLG